MDASEAQRLASAQIDTDERLLWSGYPEPSRAALSALPASAMGLPFLAFAVFWVVMAFHGVTHAPRAAGPWFLFPLFGLPFVLVGLAMVGAPLLAYVLAGRTVYAVTDKRVLIVNGSLGAGVQSFTAGEIGDFTRNERADGSGTLWFGWRGTFSRNGMPNRSRIGFVGIPGVRAVEQLIRDNVLKRAA